MITLRAAVRHERADAAAQPARPARVRPDLRVVDETVTRTRSAAGDERERRSPGGIVGTLLVVLLFVCVFGVVVFQVFLVQTQSHLDQLDRDISRQEARAKDLRLQTTDLEAPDRIVKDAKDRLGMISPGDVVYLQPSAGDDAKAGFDPTKETPPSSAAPPVTSGAGTAATGTASTGTAGTKATTTPTTSSTTPTTGTPVTTTKPKTSTTAAPTPTTVPTTAAPKVTTTVPRSPTTTATRTR